MVYRRRKIVYNYFKLKILLVTIIFLTSCSALEERLEEAKDSSLICRPADAVECIGWAGNTD